MIFNSRAFIKPKELDIYLPDIKLPLNIMGIIGMLYMKKMIQGTMTIKGNFVKMPELL